MNFSKQTVLLLLLSCQLKGSGIPLDLYTSFHAQCLLVYEAYPEDTRRRREMIVTTMKQFGIDSIQLERFFRYYRKNPEKWIEVERAVEKKLEEIPKKEENQWEGRTQ